MKYTDHEIIAKARNKIIGQEHVEDKTLDIAVDFEDEQQLTHSFVVSFKREAGKGWVAFDITEVSTQG
jgi:hypothetical protein